MRRALPAPPSAHPELVEGCSPHTQRPLTLSLSKGIAHHAAQPYPAPMLRKILITLVALVLIVAVALWVITRPDLARLSNAELAGRVPTLSTPRPQAFPTINVAPAVGWPAGRTPVAAPGLSVAAFATGLDHPRNLYVLPNGDVLVAETNINRRKKGGIMGWAEEQIMGKAGGTVPSANRITLLRDADGDGVAEVKTPFLTGLNSPYGMALVGNTLYVANTDALMAYPYTSGATSITAPGTKIVDLPAGGENRHWTKPLVAGPDGILYVGVGSNSNIAEGGLAWEQNRAAILEVRPQHNYKRPYATGLRNPSGLAIQPGTGQLWASVNERDQLGSDMVPDYMSRVDEGDFYGWPWYYWGGFRDDRVKEADIDDRREYVRRPDYALGTHVAPLGMSFATPASATRMGSSFANGTFVALHGSWNRVPAAGYTVVFVAFGPDGKPADALPITLLSGFINSAGQAMGRPADARPANDGALLVADDVGNVVWRVVGR